MEKKEERKTNAYSKKKKHFKNEGQTVIQNSCRYILQNSQWIYFWISSAFPVMQEKRLSARLYLYLNSIQGI